VTISFSFCIFFWIVVAMSMFIDNYYCYSGWYCYAHYPYAFIGELLCFMIQWGFLFYFINMLGSPCQVKRDFFRFHDLFRSAARQTRPAILKPLLTVLKFFNKFFNKLSSLCGIKCYLSIQLFNKLSIHKIKFQV
jgi:hypothetical protein